MIRVCWLAAVVAIAGATLFGSAGQAHADAAQAKYVQMIQHLGIQQDSDFILMNGELACGSMRRGADVPGAADDLVRSPGLQSRGLTHTQAVWEANYATATLCTDQIYKFVQYLPSLN